MKTTFVNAGTAAQARLKAPWAAKIVKVVGGYIAFESLDHYRIWKNQK